VRREHDQRSESSATQLGYGEVQHAATEETEAFINISYKDAQASIDKVAAGATGAFAKQYDSSTKGVIELLTQNKSVMTGEVVWAGVSSLDDDSASVIVATTGTVANKQTHNEPVARNFRLRLDLVLVDGHWLTKNLEFVD
jgi:Mce-associated membrane protein